MATKPKLDADLSGEPVDQTNYRSKIGSLMYLTSSRPDIVQAYPKDSGFELTAFLDADHAGCIDTRKSTSGGIQFLGDKLVSWMSNKQDCTAMSSAEAEYVALSTSCAQVENGIIELYFVRTEYQLANMFTKPLPEDKFQYLVRRIGMRCLTPAELEDSYKDGDGDASFQLESDSLPHAHAQTTKTYYKHQDSRIMKAQELKTKTSAQTLIYKIFLQRYQVYQGRLLASFQDDANYGSEVILGHRQNRKQNMSGFGHRVYNNYDPRAKIIKKLAEEVFSIVGRDPLIEEFQSSLDDIYQAALSDQYFVKRKLAMGFPTKFFPLLFAIPRMDGYLSHWQDSLDDPDTNIMRPTQLWISNLRLRSKSGAFKRMVRENKMHERSILSGKMGLSGSNKANQIFSTALSYSSYYSVSHHLSRQQILKEIVFSVPSLLKPKVHGKNDRMEYQPRIDEGKVHAKTEDPHEDVRKLEKDGDKAINEENERKTRDDKIFCNKPKAIKTSKLKKALCGYADDDDDGDGVMNDTVTAVYRNNSKDLGKLFASTSIGGSYWGEAGCVH
ncbi:retrovirus-related pol polyprotein from transposon TNT 1-94 [Tanacetum coccineum]